MSRFIESIRLLDGRFYNLRYHQERMSRTLQAHHGSHPPVELEKFLNEKEFPSRGLYKCRIVYDVSSKDVVYSPYSAKTIRKIKVIEDNEISYDYKYEDRRAIDRLFAQRDDCDDVLILRNQKITDCSFSNIIFRNGIKWYTPLQPLLWGTMRQCLIDENKVEPREIRLADLRSFETFKLINAMVQFDGPEIEVSEIVF